MDTPVLLLVFNRPETTRAVFDRIRKVKPKRLFVAADGPRLHEESDKESCQEVRSIVTDIDWNCELVAQFQEENLGCKKAISCGITWFFNQVEEGIILEDDCLPDLTFFGFCEIMLKKYRDDKRIMMISGNNHEILTNVNSSYFFSSYPSIWGWATWKRAWSMCIFDLEAYRPYLESREINDFSKRWKDKLTDSYHYYLAYPDKTWDIYWHFCFITNRGLSIVPRVNLISNIGLQGTNAKKENTMFKFNPTQTLDLDTLLSPQYIEPNIEWDNRYRNKILRAAGGYWKYIYRRLKSVVSID